jgi:hypothetical protein
LKTAQPTLETAGDLRAEIARQMIPLYRLAPKVGMHPAHLGQVLRERRPLSPEVAGRIRQAISQEGRGDRYAAA